MSIFLPNTPIQFASWHFILLATVAIFLFRAAWMKPFRQYVLLALNLSFIYYFIPNLASCLALAVFLIGCYGCAQVYKYFKLQQSFKAVFLVFMLSFFGLMLFKNPEFLSLINPFKYAPIPIVIVGISYLVFRGLSYLVDIELISQVGLLAYLNYMLFFPTLLSGPIARYEGFQSCIEKTPTPLTFERQLIVLNRIANGFLKKYILADNLAVFTKYDNLTLFAQNDPHFQVAVPMLWLGALLQLVTVYLDFSGYCDIAIGVGLLMGIELPENFNAPFLAKDIQDFWSRWHMSLTNFIKDYIFMPLSKALLFSTAPSHRWTLITLCYLFCMILIALWHGTTFGYLLFGVLHALALLLVQIRKRMQAKPIPVILARVSNYCFVSFTIWMAALPDNRLLPVLSQMFGLGGFH